MKYIKRYENFINEAVKFRLNDVLDDLINSIPNKKKAKMVESLLIKSILTDLLTNTSFPLEKNYSNLNTQQKLDYILNSLGYYINKVYRGKLIDIIEYINDNNIDCNSFEELHQKSIGNTPQIESEPRIIRTDETPSSDKFIEYDNGWYWINLNTIYSNDEAKNMGHCGHDLDDEENIFSRVLLSLRDNKSNSHITVSYSPSDFTIFQCKGRNNSKPKRAYHPYIMDLLLNDIYPIYHIVPNKYKPHLDFNLMDLNPEDRLEYMEYVNHHKNSINEAVKFKLSLFDTTINSIPNKKKAKVLESLLVKSLLTDFYNNIRNTESIDKKYPTWNTQQKLDYLLDNFSSVINRQYVRKLASIIDYINVNNINSDNFEDLYQKSVQWHDDIAKGADIKRDDLRVVRTDETPDTNKFIRYENGWYWINLNTHYSADEAKNMGHCGNDYGKILFSLRDNNSNSHITASYNKEEFAIYQCKGRRNSKPKQIYHEYIIDLLLNNEYPINTIVTGSYKPELDFNLKDLTDEQISNLLDRKPSLEYTDDMFETYLEDEDWTKVVSLIQNGFEYNGYVICRSLKLLTFVVNQKVDVNQFISAEWYKPILDLSSTKEDVDIYQQYFGLSKLDVNDIYILWKNGFTEYAERIKDLEIIDGKWFIKYEIKGNLINNFNFMYSDEEMGSGLISYADMVETIADDLKFVDYELSDCDLDDLKPETKKVIIDNIGLVDFDEYQIEELINSGDFGFETVEDFSIEKVIDAVMDTKRGGNCLEVLLELVDDTKNSVVRGYEIAQQIADADEAYDTAIKPLKDFFGINEFERVGGSVLLPYDPSWGLLLSKVEANPTTLSDVLECLFDRNTRLDAENYGIYEDDFPEYLEFNYPYYGFSGDIDIDVLNELVVDSLYL